MPVIHNLRTAAIVVVIVTGAGLSGCSSVPSGRAPAVTTGDAEAGERAIVRYGCGGCHVIPGVPEARAHVGPPLTDFGRRSYVAGRLPNNEDSLVRWLMDPPSVSPGTAMPDLGVSESDARDIAAYLLTLGADRAPGPAPRPRR